MTQDAKARSIALFSAMLLVLGCQTSGKIVPPTQPMKPYTPQEKAAMGKPEQIRPINIEMKNSPSRSPVVNGGASMDPPPTIVLPQTPGRSNPVINTPTIATTTPIPPAAPAMTTGSALPMTPPSPPSLPGGNDPVAPPVSSPLIPPPSLN